MTDRLRLALAQTAPLLGDVAGNRAAIAAARAEAAGQGADLVVTPRFSLGGWPPGGLARHPGFVAACEAAVADLAALTADGGPGLVVGGPWVEGGRCFDAVFLLDGGRVVARRARHEVPERGPFAAGPAPGPVAFRGVRLGLMLGADRDAPAVAETLAETGAEILVALEAAPFAPGAAARRVDHAVARVVETRLGLALVNQASAAEGLVFDGAGFVLNPDRSLAVQMPGFEPALCVTDWTRDAEGVLACAPQALARLPEGEAALWQALVLGVATQAALEGRGAAVVALEGASAAVVAALAVAALGADRVTALRLPGTTEAVVQAMQGLGGAVEAFDVAPVVAAAASCLPPGAPGIEAALAASMLELMAAARGALLLADAAPGGFAPLGALPADTVAALARWRGLPVANPGAARALPAGIARPHRAAQVLYLDGMRPDELPRTHRFTETTP
jgi:NAD+ synthase